MHRHAGCQASDVSASNTGALYNRSVFYGKGYYTNVGHSPSLYVPISVLKGSLNQWVRKFTNSTDFETVFDAM